MLSEISIILLVSFLVMIVDETMTFWFYYQLWNLDFDSRVSIRSMNKSAQ